MTDTPTENGGRIEPVELQVEMQRSYIDYSMAVIVGRVCARAAGAAPSR